MTNRYHELQLQDRVRAEALGRLYEAATALRLAAQKIRALGHDEVVEQEHAAQALIRVMQDQVKGMEGQAVPAAERRTLGLPA